MSVAESICGSYWRPTTGIDLRGCKFASIKGFFSVGTFVDEGSLLGAPRYRRIAELMPLSYPRLPMLG